MFDLRDDDAPVCGDILFEVAHPGMMLLKRSFKYRVYPTPEQEAVLVEWRGHLRWIWNTALDQRLRAARNWRQGDRRRIPLNVPGSRDGQQEQLTDLKDVYPELRTIPSCVTQNVLRVLERVWPAWWGTADPKRPPKLVLFSDPPKPKRRVMAVSARKRKRKEVEGPDEQWRWDRVNLGGLDAYLWYASMRRANPHRKLKFPKRAKGMPRFKRYDDNVPMGFTGAIHVGKNSVTLPGIGTLACVVHRSLVGRILSASLTLDVDQWYVAVACEFLVPTPVDIPEGTVGIDRGVAVTLADSSGRMVHMPELVKQLEERAAYLQSTLLAHKRSPRRGAPPSESWKKAKRRVAAKKRQARRIREEWLHAQANYYVVTYGTIKVEDLRVRNMTKSAKGTEEEPGCNVAAKAGLNRAIQQQGFGRFVEILKYKAEAAGVRVILVPPQYTSQTCSSCGHVDVESRSGRDFVCTHCGYEAHADVNAARVIAGLDGEVVTGPEKPPPRRRQFVVKKRRKEFVA